MTTYNKVSNIVDGSESWCRTTQDWGNPPYDGHQVIYCENADISFLAPALSTPDAGILTSSTGPVRSVSKNNQSWSAVKKANIIKMTDYSVYSSFLNKKLVTVPKRIDRYAHGHLHYLSDIPYGLTVDQVQYRSFPMSWDETITNEEIDSMSLPHYGGTSSVDYDTLEEAVNTVKSRVIGDSYQQWDALTSAAEFSKSLKTVTRLIKAVSRPLQTINTIIRANKLETSRQVKEVSSVWLEYRYGIRPIIFELQDMLKLIALSGFAFKTSRSTKMLDFNNEIIPPDVHCTYDEFIDTIRVGAVGKARYGSAATRVFNQTSFNVAKTAWELVPYSFVVDWFVNVGDWIESRSTMLGDIAQQRMFCHSIKHTSRIRRFYRRRYNCDSYEGVYSQAQPPVSTLVDHSDYLMQERGFDNYTRRVFQPTDVKLAFKPNLNWLKFIDGIALSSGASAKALRRLRI